MQVGVEITGGQLDIEQLSTTAAVNGFQFAKSLILKDSNPHNSLVLLLSSLLICSIEYRNIMETIATSFEDLEAHDDEQRHLAEQLLVQEIEWSAHLGLNDVVFDLTTYHNKDLYNFSRILVKAISIITFSKIWVKVGVHEWNKWNAVKSLCDGNPRLFVLLDLDGNELADIEQWIAEPVRGMSIPAKKFLTNDQGFPVLPKLMQFQFQSIAGSSSPEFQLMVVLSFRNLGGDLAAYRQYIEHLYSKSMSNDSEIIQKFAQDFYDVLQVPLQVKFH